jgi:hypothetical protein
MDFSHTLRILNQIELWNPNRTLGFLIHLGPWYSNLIIIFLFGKSFLRWKLLQIRYGYLNLIRVNYIPISLESYLLLSLKELYPIPYRKLNLLL